jgi:hypothetical protein
MNLNKAIRMQKIGSYDKSCACPNDNYFIIKDFDYYLSIDYKEQLMHICSNLDVNFTQASKSNFTRCVNKLAKFCSNPERPRSSVAVWFEF